MSKITPPRLAELLVRWQRVHGRHHLPWQNTHDAYRIWLSEVMLQQTQVVTVLDYYERFLARFPTVHDLAQATQDEVLSLWAGLGYYSRARNLHACAQTVINQHQGEFPQTPQALQTLKGIGASTAAAIAVFAYGTPAAICDGNVKRILSRVYGLSDTPSAALDKTLWQLAERTLVQPTDAQRMNLEYPQALRAYTQGVMDLGAGICRKHQPECGQCPWQQHCIAHQTQKQHEIPALKKRTVVTTIAHDWYIYLNQHHVWLEQQPTQGIWAKMWSFPTQTRHPQQPTPTLELKQHSEPAIKHRLTHRLLILTPHIIEITQHDTQALAPQGRWYPLNPTAWPALPKPVSTLLNQLIERTERTP